MQLQLKSTNDAPKRVQILRGICTPEDRLDWFPAVDQSVNWISRATSVPLRIFSHAFLVNEYPRNSPALT